jgi:hypothetical protein
MKTDLTAPLSAIDYDEGLAGTWLGGEPSEPAMVVLKGCEDDPDKGTIAYLNIDMDWKDQNAYARLFAAAPDLKYACVLLLEGDAGAAIDVAVRAMAKAEGRSDE